jgi:polysaccharide pyruvyl transferase WcaK-like protein
VVPDLAYSYPEPAPRADEGNVVAVNPYPWFDRRYWPEDDPARYERFLASLASFVEWLARNDYRVRLVATKLPHDPWVIEDLLRILDGKGLGERRGSIEQVPVRSLDDVIDAMARSRFVVAARFHGIVAALLLRRPVIAVSYHHKTTDLMGDLGLADYCVDIDRLELGVLTGLLKRLETERGAILSRIETGIAAHRAALEGQYRRILSL